MTADKSNRCNNCPGKGCYDCPMFGVGENPIYQKRRAEAAARKQARLEAKQKEDDGPSSAQL